LTQSDVIALRELRDDLILICQRAAERNVKIIMDAEYSWYQPAIDAFVLALQMRFNKLDSDTSSNRVQPLVYQTYQAYLRRTPEYLRWSLSFAQRHGFALGVKLVRGAYHPQEITAHKSKGSSRSLSISDDVSPPVWSSKPETDKCYDECVTVLIDAVQADITPPANSFSGGWLRWFAPSSSSPKPSGTPTIGVLFGTHNHDSCIHILFQLAARGMATDLLSGVLVLPDAVTGRIAMGQLYGMHDQLTNDLVDGTRSTSPFIIKYVPYGALKEVSLCLHLCYAGLSSE
jgi:proline dehydrogenase